MWALSAIVTVEIAVTYTRFPAHELYHVSGAGLSGGASRVLVFLNFPLALVAIPISALVFAELRSRVEKTAAVLGVALSAVIFWPGVVKQSDLDARWVNVVPALGVLVAAALSVLVVVRLGRLTRFTSLPRDRLRLAIGAAVLALAVPWLAADVGVSFEGVPVLGSLYQTTELRTQPNVAGLHPAVHHGHHHGMDGVLLVWTALLLSRLLPTVRRRPRGPVLGAYLALMLCYGIGNVANDFWLEQIVKRGWTDWEIPDVTTPKASIAWAVIVLAAAVVWGFGVYRSDTGARADAATPASEVP